MSEKQRRNNKPKVLVTMLFAVIALAMGDIMLRRGMGTVGVSHFQSIPQLLVSVANSNVIIGILFMIVFFVLYLAALSWEDLSFVLPLTAADYILVTLIADIWLREHVSPIRWGGTMLVAVGIALVTRS